ncbi:MAG: hypothetical protein AB1705_03740 [Verrucomicrobiota bacterium]
MRTIANLGFWFLALIVLATTLGGCATRSPEMPLVLNYSEMGPQIMAHEIIGYEWFQWHTHGDPDPRKTDPIMVVIYDKLPFSEIRKRYPVSQKDLLDYRYLNLQKALLYLDRYAQQFPADQLPTETSRKITAHFSNRLNPETRKP